MKNKLVSFFKGIYDLSLPLRLPVDKHVGNGFGFYIVGHYVGESFVSCYETRYKSHLSKLKHLHSVSYPNYSVVVFMCSTFVERI